MPATASIDAARSLLAEWVESPSLRRHCEAVGTAMAAYAPRFGGDAERWRICGLLHDADYERHPDMDDERDGHPRTVLRRLEQEGGDPEIAEAIAGHADYLGVPRRAAMARTLFAVDELCGFVVACCAVRPDGIEGLTARSVRKKLRSPSFAAAVDRGDIEAGAAELGLPLDEHITNVIAALAAEAASLGLTGR